MRVGVRVGLQDSAFEPLTTRLLLMLNALSTSYYLHASNNDDITARQNKQVHMIPFRNSISVSLSRLAAILGHPRHLTLLPLRLS